ncbi:MAG: hypothetical protein WC314_15825 [Vulcanimicrobiota bacterium]
MTEEIVLNPELFQDDEPRTPSARLVPELEARLRESGLLTAIVTLDSPRFKHYLKKPANLLHDRWTYLERGVDRTVIYRLGTPRGLRQDLIIKPVLKQAIVETVDPRTGRSQSIVYDMKRKCIISNIVTFLFEDGVGHYNYLFLNKRIGSLEAFEIEDPIEEACVALAG